MRFRVFLCFWVLFVASQSWAGEHRLRITSPEMKQIFEKLNLTPDQKQKIADLTEKETNRHQIAKAESRAMLDKISAMKKANPNITKEDLKVEIQKLADMMTIEQETWQKNLIEIYKMLKKEQGDKLMQMVPESRPAAIFLNHD